eukprot:2588133-Karenia_brevis.AAC.1
MERVEQLVNKIRCTLYFDWNPRIVPNESKDASSCNVPKPKYVTGWLAPAIFPCVEQQINLFKAKVHKRMLYIRNHAVNRPFSILMLQAFRMLRGRNNFCKLTADK